MYDNTTFCLVDGKIKEMNPIEIFDWRLFNEFHGVTFSASRKFILKYLFYYKTIELVIGIPKDSVQRNIVKTFEDLNNYYKIDYRNPTNTDLKHDFLGAEAYFLPRGIVHSKIFLLSNQAKNKYRTIIGSANLSEAAFSNKKNQYEEIQIFNDKQHYNIAFKRYQAILDKATGYIDPETKKHLKRMGYFK